MNPFFSVVIPAYNRADRIEVAIRSVLSQTFKDFELIVVDDGSTDDTPAIVLAIEDTRIRYFKKANEERSIARNFGIDHATGRYINFLDSDDRLHAHHLQVAFEVLQRNEFPETAHLGFEVVNDKGKVVRRSANFDGDIRAKMIEENILVLNAMLIRSDVAREYKFIQHPKAIISEDWYVVLRLVARFKMHFKSTITSVITEHPGRSLNNINAESLITSTELVNEALQRDPVFMEVYGKRARYFFANQYTFVSLILSLKKTTRKKTWYYLMKAVKEDRRVIFRRRFLASINHWIFRN